MTEPIFSIRLRADGWKYFISGKRVMKDTGETEFVTKIVPSQRMGIDKVIDYFDVYYNGRKFVSICADEVEEIRYDRSPNV